MRANWKSTVLAVLGIACLAVAVPMTVASAQEPGLQDAGQRGGIAQRDQRARGTAPRQQPGDMQRMMQRMGGGGGGTAMVQDQNFLYVVQGGQILKIAKRDLSVVARGFISGGPGGSGAPCGPGESDRARRRGGGGRGADIPPLELPGDPIPPTE